MPQVSNRAVEEMLKNADPQSRRLMKNILNGKLVAKICCLSEDIIEQREVSVLDEEGNQVFYKSGAHKGEPKMKTEEFVAREGCKGRHIGNIIDTGQRDQANKIVTIVEPVAGADGKMYLRSTRQRLDGSMGCECWCGQDSRIAPQEVGHITGNGAAPTRAGLQAIFDNIQENPTVPEVDGNVVVVDGFKFEGGI